MRAIFLVYFPNNINMQMWHYFFCFQSYAYDIM